MPVLLLNDYTNDLHICFEASSVYRLTQGRHDLRHGTSDFAFKRTIVVKHIGHNNIMFNSKYEPK